MKPTITRRGALLSAVVPLVLRGADEEHNTLSAAEKKAGWILLFDGKTWNNWHGPESDPRVAQSFAIEDGSLRVLVRPAMRKDLISRQAFGDFEMTWDWKTAPRGNTGVKYLIQDVMPLDERGRAGQKFEATVGEHYRQHMKGALKLAADAQGQEYVFAYEYQLGDSSPRPGQQPNPSNTGALYSLIAPTSVPAKPVGEWNTSRIVLQKDTVQHWLNGEKVLETRLDNPAIDAGFAKRWKADAPEVYELLSKLPKRRCPVALQNHNDEAWFRNIKIRNL